MKVVRECPVEGCNGFFGPGCMVDWPHPLFHKCNGNYSFYSKVWDAVGKMMEERNYPKLTETDVEPF